MRWAIILRMLVMGTRSPGNAAGAGGAAGRAAAAGGAAGETLEVAVEVDALLTGALDCPSMNERMSCFVMRPPSPVPETWERFTPCSRAILRTRGDERASSSASDSCGGGALAAGLAAADFLSSCR